MLADFRVLGLSTMAVLRACILLLALCVWCVGATDQQQPLTRQMASLNDKLDRCMDSDQQTIVSTHVKWSCVRPLFCTERLNWAGETPGRKRRILDEVGTKLVNQTISHINIISKSYFHISELRETLTTVLMTAWDCRNLKASMKNTQKYAHTDSVSACNIKSVRWLFVQFTALKLL